MARFTLKRSLRDASCWNLLVVKGAAALRRRSFLSTERTLHCALRSAFVILSDSSPFETSVFSPSIPTKRASKDGGFVRCASIVQYSFFSNALMSRSRSTMRRSAKPATNLVPQQRGDLVPDNAIKNATRLLRVNQIPVDLARMIECSLHGLGSDFVERHPMDGNTAASLLLRLGFTEFFVQMCSDGLAFAVRVRREVNGGSTLRLLL